LLALPDEVDDVVSRRLDVGDVLVRDVLVGAHVGTLVERRHCRFGPAYRRSVGRDAVATVVGDSQLDVRLVGGAVPTPIVERRGSHGVGVRGGERGLGHGLEAEDARSENVGPDGRHVDHRDADHADDTGHR
jgi:hypothetical protein